VQLDGVEYTAKRFHVLHGGKGMKLDIVLTEETFSILNVRTTAFYIYGDGNMGGNILYKYLGLKPQDKVKTDVINGETWKISAEVIPQFIGDHLFLAVNKGAEDALKSNESIWKNTNAVKNKKVYSLDFDLFLQSDPIAVTKQLVHRVACNGKLKNKHSTPRCPYSS
jgi:iron complex transport system substrate-binding protein